jgi:hypothetical protein
MVLIKKWVSILILFFLFFISLTPLYLADQTYLTTDITNLSFTQELIIPIDTSLEESKYQPIDIRVNFNSVCWAKNETQHSIRVGYGDQSDLTEIESQIYDLTYTDESHISSCNIIFLIPEDATGSEKYYILYNDQSTNPPSYPNHFKIKDTHYFYEPISGQIIDFDYYQIIEDDFIIYGIVQKGELLGNGMSNTIIKLLPGSKEFKTKNAEQITSYHMSYSTEPPGTYTGSQWATDIEKTILVKGNLMIRVQIKGISPNGNIQTDNIYTYYYCPQETKRIHVNIDHDVLKTVEIKGNKERDGSYCSISTIKARSGTIEDMNIGEILPKIHIYNEDDTIRSYDIPTDPSAHPADWLLSTIDDEDLGSHAWFCMDDPSTGQVHGLIFDRNTGFLNGSDDGIQVKSSVHQHVKLPGLEADSGDLYAMRNAYENGAHSTTLSDDIRVKFNVVYVASSTGGYEQIEKESHLLQTLSKVRPIKRGNQTDIQEIEEQKERYTLTVLLHNVPSAPLGSLLSAATGRNISYITAELYKENNLASSGSAQRLQLGDVNIDLEGKSTREIIQTIRNIFDLRNSTIFKSVRFPDLDQGTYLIKICKENPFLGKDRKYIGYVITEVSEDSRIHVTCKSEMTMNIFAYDQNDDPIKDIQLKILIEEISISNSVTDENGLASLKLPYDKQSSMTLQGIYQGFSVFKNDISFGILDRWRTPTETITIDLFDLTIKVTDTLGLPPAINPTPLLTSDKMAHQMNIQPSQTTQNLYYFSNLYSNTYHLKMSYKSFKIEEKIDVNNDMNVDVLFPAEFNTNIEVLDSFGLTIDDASCLFKRENRDLKVNIEQGKTIITVPPGNYNMKITNEEAVIATQKIEIKGDKTLTIISNQNSMLHTLATIIFLVGGICGGIYFLIRKKRRFAFNIILAMIILISIFQPWWMLKGESNDVTTKTTTILYPANIITLTSSSNVIGGELSEVPEEFTMILNLLTYLLLIASILILIHMLIFKQFPKMKLIIHILIIIFLLLSVILFYIAMSEVTKVGIGEFLGSDTLKISIPGESNQIDIPSSWGPSSGMILCIVGLIGSLIFLFQRKITPFLEKYLPFMNNN